MKNADMPAMPTKSIDTAESYEYATGGGRYLPANGLTKREMFAMNAMQGLLSNSGGVIQGNPMGVQGGVILMRKAWLNYL